MNYYEELGLTPDAPDEDVRKVHRTLSKLLHPDLQTDPAAREAAELQMRRINAIIDVLLDPQRRREYDAGLLARPTPVVYVRPGERNAPARRRFGGPVSTLLVMMAVALGLTSAAVWFLDGDLFHFEMAGEGPAPLSENGAPATSRQHAPATPTRVRPPASAARTNNPVSEPPRVEVESAHLRQAVASTPQVRPPEAPQHPPERIARAGSAVPPVRMVPTPVQGTPVAPPPQPVSTPSAPAANVLTRQAAPATATAPRDTLAGLWLYAPNSLKAGRTKIALYAPEYIQLQILAEGGIVRGEYSARYRVPDRPISPEVTFHFEGKAGGPGSFEWHSDDGSRGVVDLKMLTADSLQVNWRVSRFGTRQGLGAGTAVLIRKIEP
ncbi:MAG: DnaJ domain-containing protein [Bryobacteraceae bacterium]|jgi:curved DNA-binding protein CbpA